MWWTGLVVAAFCLWGFAVTVGAFLAVLMTEAVAR